VAEPGCLRCGAMLGTAMQVSDTPSKYETFYESGKDEGGDFFRCLKCGARNYYLADADGLHLQMVKEPPAIPVRELGGKFGQGVFNVLIAIIVLGVLLGLFTTPVLAGIAIVCAVAVFVIHALTKR